MHLADLNWAVLLTKASLEFNLRCWGGPDLQGLDRTLHDFMPSFLPVRRGRLVFYLARVHRQNNPIWVISRLKKNAISD
jgi:hypothetical protein